MSLSFDQKMAATRTLCNLVGVIISIIYVVWVMSK
jgi:hypothetical protein